MKYALAITIAAACATSAPALADEGGNFAISAGGGTTGVTVEGQYGPNEFLTLRIGGNFFKYSRDETVDDVDYEGDFEFSGPNVFVDLHPFGNSFMLTGGAYFGSPGIDLFAEPSGPVDIGGQTFLPSEIGILDGQADYSSTVPFVGIGFDNTFTRDRRWGFKAIAGAGFMGDPDVTLISRDGLLSNDPVLTQALNDEADDVETELDDYKVYPVLQLGLTYRF